MKIQLPILSLLFLLMATMNPARAQDEEGTIAGKIVDGETGTPLEYATISIFSISDSSLVNGASTGPDGAFFLSVPYGRYYAKLQFLSYGDSFIDDIRLTPSNPQVKLGALELQPDSKTLAEVEVVGEQQQVQFSLDKRVFNVDESLATIGGTASDILDNIPSVTVDVEGNISLRGSQDVQVLIDGKPSGLVGLSSTEALRTLPADMIERVEVITNPSARYQAEGSAGIINIILKKEKRDGFNGAFSANTGYPHNHGASVNLNYRKNWYNVFANYGFRYYEFPRTGYQNEIFYDPEQPGERVITGYRNSVNEDTRRSISNTIRFGSDFFLNEQNTLTTAFLYRKSESESDETVTYNHFNENREFTGSNARRTIEIEPEPTYEVDVNYRRTFDEEDKLLTFNFQYRNNSEVEEADIRDIALADAESDLAQKTFNSEDSRNFLFQLDFINPFGENGRWEAGLRSDLSHNINDFVVNDLENGQWMVNTDLTNNFIYTENIHAAYGIVGNKIGRFSYQAGLRAEYSDITSELQQTAETYPRNYLSLFPSTHITYEMSESKAVQWSYSRRIRRPRSGWLNPFNTISDPTDIWRGNPYLNPELTHALELAYLHHFAKASFTGSIYYRHTDDEIERVRLPLSDAEAAALGLPPIDDDQQRFQTIPMNLATEDAFGLELIFNADITNWWTTNTDFNFYRQIIQGGTLENVDVGELNSDTYTWNARSNMQFKILPGLSSQVTFFYRSPRETPQGERKSFYVFDAGVRKDIFNNKGSISLNVNDVFNSRRFRSISFGETFRSEGEFQWRPRSITLGFTYQLRRTTKKENGRPENQQNDGGGEDMEF